MCSSIYFRLRQEAKKKENAQENINVERNEKWNEYSNSRMQDLYTESGFVVHCYFIDLLPVEYERIKQGKLFIILLQIERGSQQRARGQRKRSISEGRQKLMCNTPPPHQPPVTSNFFILLVGV